MGKLAPTTTLFSLSELSQGLVQTGSATEVVPAIVELPEVVIASESMSLLSTTKKPFHTSMSTFSPSKRGLVANIGNQTSYEIGGFGTGTAELVKDKLEEEKPDSKTFYQIINPNLVGSSLSGVSNDLSRGKRQYIIIRPGNVYVDSLIPRVAGFFSMFPAYITAELNRKIMKRQFSLVNARNANQTVNNMSDFSLGQYCSTMFNIILTLHLVKADDASSRADLEIFANQMTEKMISKLGNNNDGVLKTNERGSMW